MEENVQVVEQESKKGLTEKGKKILKWVGIGTAAVVGGIACFLLGKNSANKSDDYDDYSYTEDTSNDSYTE